MESEGILMGVIGFIFGCIVGSRGVSDLNSAVSNRIKVVSGNLVLTARAVASGVVNGKSIVSYLLLSAENTEAVMDIWEQQNRQYSIEIAKLTWNPINIYVDGVLKYTIPATEKYGVGTGYCSFGI